MPSLSVAFDMTFANRNRGGTRVYARSLFASLRDREDVAAWVINGPMRSGIAGTLAWLLQGARGEISSRPPDLLHCPSFVAPWRVPVPFVVTVHDAAGRRFPADHPLEWRVYDRRFLGPRLQAASRVITGSEFSRKEIIAAYELQADRVVAVAYGLDPRFLLDGGEDDSTGAGPILFPGAPIGRKNLDAVLECMAAARQPSALSVAMLEITGATVEQFPRYGSLIRSLGLGSRVRWLGQVPADEMVATIRRAAVVAYPSLYEGFGFPPLEAMAVGTPVVASDRGSLPEVLGDAALLVDPEDRRAVGDALEAALSRPDVRDRLRRDGRARARTFTWERCTDRTLDVYRDVLASPKGVAA